MEKCPECEKEVDKSFSFCPYCGEPLNESAKQFYKLKDQNAQLKMLYALISKIDDKKSLKILKAMVDAIEKK
jgi:predicted amidophosphoribosyltransferase